MECHTCGSRDIDFHESMGHSACVSCGTVVEENTIVSSIEFQETGDRSHVIGQFVSATCSKPYNAAVRARGRYGNSRESRDTTLAQARRIIAQVANQLRLPSGYIDRAYRLYQMALDKKFVFGRRQVTVVATCLYTVCRQEKSPHLLIDFSDALQVNVFLLGSSFLRFIRMLNMDIDLPTVDPALYIHRFATRLEVGDKLNQIITMSLRLVTRLKKDWICTGRRPDGICAAAILIATRAHGFHKSQGEIAKLFRVSTDTLKNRLDDFKATPSAHLTIEQFLNNDATTEYDPPSYIKKLLSEVTEDSSTSIDIQLPGGTIDDEVEYDDDDDDGDDDDEKRVRFQKTVIGNVEINFPCPNAKEKKSRVSEKKQARQKERAQLYGTLYVDLGNSINPDDDETRDKLLKEAQNAKATSIGGWGSKKSRIDENHTEVSIVVSSAKRNDTVDLQIDELENLNQSNEKDNETMTEILLDNDLDNYLLTDEEQKKKSVIWERSYRNFIDERQRKRVERENEENQQDESGNIKIRKKYARRDGSKSSTAQDDSKRTSKKINYDALQAAVFDGQGNFFLPDSTDIKNASNNNSSSNINNNNNNNNNKIINTNTKVAKPKAPKKSKGTYVVEDIDDFEDDDDEIDNNKNASKKFNDADHIEYFDDNGDNDYEDDYDDDFDDYN